MNEPASTVTAKQKIKLFLEATFHTETTTDFVGLRALNANEGTPEQRLLNACIYTENSKLISIVLKHLLLQKSPSLNTALQNLSATFHPATDDYPKAYVSLEVNKLSKGDLTTLVQNLHSLKCGGMRYTTAEPSLFTSIPYFSPYVRGTILMKDLKEHLKKIENNEAVFNELVFAIESLSEQSTCKIM